MRTLRILLAPSMLALLLSGCAVETAFSTPVADAGPDLTCAVGEGLAVHGSASLEGATFLWRIASGPEGAELLGPDAADPTFVPAVPGRFVLSLSVASGGATSAPDYVEITAVECDADGDLARRPGASCGGDDCDDTDPRVHPGAADPCGDGLDQDCDGSDDACCGTDADGDGFVSSACAGGDDCDDSSAAVNPGATEVPGQCENGVDEDCAGGDLPCGCADGDGDGHAAAACGGDDCDDAAVEVHPGVVDLCDGVDDDCDGADANSCRADQRCAGAAGCECLAGSECGGRCVDPLTDPDSCGGCGNPPCGAGEACVLGSCTGSCPGSQELCGRSCVDTAGDPGNCGGCGAACADQALETTACVASVCGCAPGLADLDGGRNGCECAIQAEICGDGIDQDCSGADLSCGCADADSDGHPDVACGGDDCDDTAALTFPGAAELCGDGIDQDCSGADLLADADGDGALALACGGDDCDDGRPEVNPAATELCADGLDNDCSGSELLADADADGFLALACGGDDCDDFAATVHPGAVELCGNAVDEDCSGADLPPDTDGDGHDGLACAGDDCDDGDAAIHPGAPELCGNGIDEDCSGADLPADVDGDGHSSVACGGGDCDDGDPLIGPGIVESCDGVDQDCDGTVDDSPGSYSCGPTVAAHHVSGGGFVRDFLVLGPVPVPGAPCFETATELPGGDALADPQPGDGALGLRWEPFHSAADTLNLDGLAGGAADDQLLYLFARLLVPAAGHYELQLEDTDAVRLSLDGAPVLLTFDPEACGDNSTHKAVVYLRAGVHRLLIRTSTDGGQWDVKLRIAAPRISGGGGAELDADELGIDLGEGTSVGNCQAGAATCDLFTGAFVCTGAIGPQPELCSGGGDEDCDGDTDEDDEDLDLALASACGGSDCDDHDRQVGPGQPELCDAGNRDENCDGAANDLGPLGCGSGPSRRVDGTTGYLFDWLLYGPIDGLSLGSPSSLDPRDLSALLGGPAEASLAPGVGDVAGPFGWSAITSPTLANGFVDLAAAIGAFDDDRVTVYAYATVWSPTARQARLVAGSSDGLLVLLNGAPVVTYTGAARNYTAATESATVDLAAGPNRLLVKVSNIAGTFGFGLRFLDPGSSAPLVDLGIDLGEGVTRGACVAGTRTCGPAGFGPCTGAVGGGPELCNGGIDDDCDGVVTGEADLDGDGAAPCGGDCNESRADIGPAQPEVCNSIDDDCDGVADDARSDDDNPDPALCDGVADAVCKQGAGVFTCPAGTPARCRVTAPGGSCGSNADCDSALGTSGWICVELWPADDLCLKCAP